MIMRFQIAASRAVTISDKMRSDFEKAFEFVDILCINKSYITTGRQNFLWDSFPFA